MTTPCKNLSAKITRVNIAGKGLKAETPYSQATVRVENTGHLPWRRQHAIKVWLSIGDDFNSPVKQQTWAQVLSRDVKPGQSVEVRLRGFTTPRFGDDDDGRRQLIAWVSCGPGGRHRLTRWRGRFTISAKFEADLLTTSLSLKPLARRQLGFRFRNVSDFTFPGGESWSVRVRVDRAPRLATKKAREAFEFEAPLRRWGRADVEPGAIDEATYRMESVPPFPGTWDLDVTLMRGNEPFEPCAGTPADLRCRIERYDPLKVAKGEIEHVDLDGGRLVAETARPVWVRLRNTGPVTWYLKEGWALVGGTGKNWAELKGNSQWMRLDRSVPADSRFRYDLPVFRAPSAVERTERRDLTVYLVCGRISESNIIAEYHGHYTLAALWFVFFDPPRARRYKPGTPAKWAVSAINQGKSTWPYMPPWEIESEVIRAPSSASSAERKVFEFRHRVPPGVTDIAYSNRLSVVHTIDNVPDVPGDWAVKLTLRRGGRPFDARISNAVYEFEISEALSEAEIELTRVPASLISGKVVDVVAVIENKGGAKLQPREYSVSITADVPGTSSRVEVGSAPGAKEIGPGEKLQVPVTITLDLPPEELADGAAQVSLTADLKAAKDGKVLDRSRARTTDVEPEDD